MIQIVRIHVNWAFDALRAYTMCYWQEVCQLFCCGLHAQLGQSFPCLHHLFRCERQLTHPTYDPPITTTFRNGRVDVIAASSVCSAWYS